MGILSFVGMGIHDAEDISVKGKKTVTTADRIFAELYTSKLSGNSEEEIKNFFKRNITFLSREQVEGEEIILDSAEKGDTVLLTAGDPMSATTHHSLRMGAMKKGIKVRIIHSSSIFTAVPGLVGLPAYKFGRATTIARPEKNFFPTSPYEVIRKNLEIGLHTLVLLDIKSEKNYFMTAQEGMGLLLEMERELKENILLPETKPIVVARAGSQEPLVWYGTIEEGMKKEFGPPLHSLVVVGKCHFMEKEMLEYFTREF